MALVFSVYKDHKDALRAACWDHSKSTEKAYLGKAAIRLAPTGKVLSSKTEGTDELASACVDKQIKKWKFPPPNGTADIVLPVHMHRDWKDRPSPRRAARGRQARTADPGAARAACGGDD